MTKEKKLVEYCQFTLIILLHFSTFSLFHFRRSLFLYFPSRAFSHSRHSSMAFSLSSRELAGLKFSQTLVASRRHISAKNLVCKSSDESSSINSSIVFSVKDFLKATYSLRFII